MFRQIQAYSKSWHSQTYSYIIRHIHNPQLVQAYSEPLKYLAGFRHYSRTIHAYSEPYLGRFRHIQNSGLFRHVMLHVCPGKFTKLHIFRHAFFLTLGHISADSGIFRILALPVQITQSNTCSSSQVILLNHCSNLFGKKPIFAAKVNIQNFFIQDSISIITIKIIVACHPRQHAIHPTHTTHARKQRKLERHPRHPRQDAIHASTPPTLARIAHHFPNSSSVQCSSCCLVV